MVLEDSGGGGNREVTKQKLKKYILKKYGYKKCKVQNTSQKYFFHTRKMQSITQSESFLLELLFKTCP